MKGNRVRALMFAALLLAMIVPWKLSGQPEGIGRSACYDGALGSTVTIEGGRYAMGSEHHYPEEGPVIEVAVEAFDIEVTNAQFLRFVEETGYVTSAERATELGFDANGSAVFADARWAFVAGGNWWHPLVRRSCCLRYRTSISLPCEESDACEGLEKRACVNRGSCGRGSRPMTEGLSRELGVFGATMLGLGSILGTGIFVSIGIAAGAAGPAVILAIVLAAGLATCNALSSAQLAAAYPVSGGTYEYGYRLLHPLLGFIAGWMFLCAKTASAATAAIGAAGYGLHVLGFAAHGWMPVIAAAIVVALTILVLAGLRRSSVTNVAIVSVTLLALVGFAAAGFLHVATEGVQHFTPFLPEVGTSDIAALMYATALMFVAYTGYARIATMSEEVTNPRSTIPKAIVLTLAASATLYVLVAIAAIGAVGSESLAGSAMDEATPLERAAAALEVPGLTVLVAVGAVTAMLAVLLNLVLGLSRMALAMGRRRDLPPVFAGIACRGVPRVAVAAVGFTIAVVALIGDVEATWAFSAFTVLIYYAVTNLAALRLPQDRRLYPRAVAWAGLGGCLFLTPFLPLRIWLTGAALILGGLLWRVAARRIWPHDDDTGGS